MEAGASEPEPLTPVKSQHVVEMMPEKGVHSRRSFSDSS